MSAEHEHIYPGDERYDGFRVTECWAFLGVDPSDNQEGSPVVEYDTQDGPVLSPMIAFDERRVEHLKPVAKDIAARIGKPVRLVRFSVLEDLEVFEP